MTDPLCPATTVVHAGRRHDYTGQAVNPPVWRASTVLYPDVASLKAGVTTNADGHWFYGRRGTPTQWSLAEAITALDPAAHGTMLYPSGVAAVAGALLTVLKPGDHLLMVDTTYDPTRRFCDEWLAGWGVETSYYAPQDDLAALLRPNTTAIFMEAPGSLTFELQDVPTIVALARARGVATLIDNTWATPLLLPASSLGVDLVVTACTKYVAGHSDVMLGSVSALEPWWQRLRATAQMHGVHVAPDDAYLASRGLRTLDIRLKRHGQSALTLATWLQDHPKVARVLHPALAEPALFARQFRASSGLFGFTLRDGDPHRLVDALEHFGIGYSWGGYESLAVPVEPARCRSAEAWAGGTVIRLSIGLEDVEDLRADLQQALAAA